MVAPRKCDGWLSAEDPSVHRTARVKEVQKHRIILRGFQNLIRSLVTEFVQCVRTRRDAEVPLESQSGTLC